MINCHIRQMAYWRPRSVAPALHPAGAPNFGRRLEEPHNQEDTMLSITTIVLPIILAAGISGLMFTATLV
jgi:hypothetical protein